MSTHPVGFIVSWRVPATVPLNTLRDAIRDAGLDAAELVPDLKPPQLVARTAGFIARLTSNAEQRKLSRPISHTARQITTEEIAGDSLTYTREAALQIDEPTGKIVCDDPGIAAMLPSTTAEVYETRTASDVTRIIQRIVEAAGSDLIPVREQGGAYFIPTGGHLITQLNTLLEQIEGDLTTFACTLGHGTDESVSMTISEYLIKQIDELKESVDLLNEKGVRSDVKNRRLSRVAELKEKIRTYGALLKDGTDKLDKELERAETTLLMKLGPEEEEEDEEPVDRFAASGAR